MSSQVVTMPGPAVQSGIGSVCLVLAELSCKRQLALHGLPGVMVTG